MKRENLIIILIIALVVIYFVSDKKEKFFASPAPYNLKTNEGYNGTNKITLPTYKYIMIENNMIKSTDDKTKATKFTDNLGYDIKLVSNDSNNGKHIFMSPNLAPTKVKYNSNYNWQDAFKHLAFETTATIGALKTGTSSTSSFLYFDNNNNKFAKKYYSSTNNPTNPTYSTFVKETAA